MKQTKNINITNELDIVKTFYYFEQPNIFGDKVDDIISSWELAKHLQELYEMGGWFVCQRCGDSSGRQAKTSLLGST